MHIMSSCVLSVMLASAQVVQHTPCVGWHQEAVLHDMYIMFSSATQHFLYNLLASSIKDGLIRPPLSLAAASRSALGAGWYNGCITLDSYVVLTECVVHVNAHPSCDRCQFVNIP